jgi:hypothetical protein
MANTGTNITTATYTRSHLPNQAGARPEKVFQQPLLGKGGFVVPLWNHIGIVCHGATHWLAEYYVLGDMRSSSYHTLNESVETCNISLERSFSTTLWGCLSYPTVYVVP